MDHLDYIRIRGLVDNDAECFQGISASLTSTSTSTGGTTPTDWGTLPEDIVTTLQAYYADQEAWISEMEALGDEQEEEGSARKLRELPAIIKNAPLVPLIVSLVTTGGASLPLVFGEIAIQIGLSLADAQLRNLFNRLNPCSLENQLKELVTILKTGLVLTEDGIDKGILSKALLFTLEDGTLESVIDKALNYDLPVTGEPLHRSVLKDGLDRVGDLDVTLKYADNTSLAVKGRVLRR
jgi:hypothetical protein